MPRPSRLSINSPGGSPAQSHLIFRRIRATGRGEEIAGASPSSRTPPPPAATCSPAPPTRSSADPIFHRRLDRRGRRLVRLRQADRQARRRAPALYVGRPQGDARSVPAGRSRGRRAAQGDLQQEIHDDFIALVKSRRGAKLNGAEDDCCSPANTGPAGARSDSAWSTPSATCARRCAHASATRSYTPLITADRSLFGRRLFGVGAAALLQGPGPALPKT